MQIGFQSILNEAVQKVLFGSPRRLPKGLSITIDYGLIFLNSLAGHGSILVWLILQLHVFADEPIQQNGKTNGISVTIQFVSFILV